MPRPNWTQTRIQPTNATERTPKGPLCHVALATATGLEALAASSTTQDERCESDKRGDDATHLLPLHKCSRRPRQHWSTG